MAIVTSRQTLIDHCLRRLGAPVIEINVDDDQVEDKVDDAIQYWQEFNSDATVKTYFKHQVTQTDIDTKAFTLDPNENVATQNILEIIRMLPLTSSYAASRNFFDVKYQLMLNDMASMNTFIGDLGYYNQMQQYLSLLDDMLGGQPQVAWSRKEGKIYIHGDIEDGDIKLGDYVVFEVLQLVDTTIDHGNEAMHRSVWNDRFIKDITTQLIKQQWGMNLIKFDNMILPGGVQLNGRQFYDDATAEIERLREVMRLEYEFPPDFFMG